MILKVLGGIVLLFGTIFFLAFIYAFFISLAWNCVMPSIFNLPTIGYWQAFVLSFLCGLLFKSNVSTK